MNRSMPIESCENVLLKQYSLITENDVGMKIQPSLLIEKLDKYLATISKKAMSAQSNYSDMAFVFYIMVKISHFNRQLRNTLYKI